MAASNGVAPAPQMLLRALAGGAVPVASRLPLYEEVLGDGDLGLLFEPRDADTLAAQLARLVADAPLRKQLSDRIAEVHDDLAWSRVADEFEALYAEIAARRHDPRASRRCGSGWGGEISSTSTYTCTRTTHTTARPPSTSCSRPPRSAAWARSP